MTTVAVVGARGFVGAEIVRAFQRQPDVTATAVTRDNYLDARSGEYDLVVNAAMPAARFWARKNPLDDFRETVQKTVDLFYGWTFRRFLQISSVSARCQLDTVYGRHKAAAETVCRDSDTLIVRLGPMYGETLQKGVLIDILNGHPVFAAPESRYCFAPVAFVAGWIASNWERRGTVEVGARNALALGDVAAHLGRIIEFSGSLDHQEIPTPEMDFPDATDVLAFLDAKNIQR